MDTTLSITQLDGPEYTISVPSVEDVLIEYDPPPANFCKGGKGEIFAIGSSVYWGVPPEAYDSHRNLCLRAAWDYGPGSIWILPTRPRLPYPISPLYSLASLLKTERIANRRADWFVWIDDDVIVPAKLIRKLREAADPETRPFVATAGFDRYPPFSVAVFEHEMVNGVQLRKQWVAEGPIRPGEKVMPSSGIHQVAVVGLCAAIFHRSFFDKVPQPWFVYTPTVIVNGIIAHRAATDNWLSRQCEKVGVPVCVTCDVDITHIGLNMPVNRKTAKALRRIFTRGD